MEVNKIISHALQSMPAEQTSEGICEGHLKTDPYGIKTKTITECHRRQWRHWRTLWREAIFILILRQYC